MLNRAQHSHEEHGPDAAPTATYTTLTAKAVAVEGCKATQPRNLFIRQRAELREVGQQSIDDMGADTRH